MSRWVTACTLIAILVISASAQETQPRFGGEYSALDERRQRLVDNWVARFTQITGKTVEPGAFYDAVVRLSTKTTFEAVTHALMTTAMTDEAGNSLGDALDLVEHVDTVRGKVLGAPGDRQFRMYARLKEDALETLARSQQFRRRRDNTVYHRGYPINFRGEGGTPSIQFSVALDARQADIDVDYRSSSFPAGLFNGHLTASNSDVRAGNNYDRHTGRWTGFRNWWQNFFGISLPTDDNVEKDGLSETLAPRIGKKPVEAMAQDFLKAWLLEGDIRSAMSYVSPRAFACLSEDSDGLSMDRGMAPFVLAHRLKAAHDELGRHTALDGLVVGVRLTTPGLRMVKQPHHAQFVVYAVPDDVAAAFECENRHTPGDTARVRRAYGNYAGTTFYITGRELPVPVALLWGRDRGYWRIVSWQTEPESSDDLPDPAVPSATEPERIAADPSLVQAAHRFLDSWLIRKDYDTAFGYVSPKAYACYDLVRAADRPASVSLDDAGTKVRAGFEQAGASVGRIRGLDDVISAAPPFHPAIRIMDHRYAQTFSLSSVPTTLADAVDCSTRSGTVPTMDGPPEYGRAFEMTARFRTRVGDPGVFRTLWIREDGAWRITVYDVEIP